MSATRKTITFRRPATGKTVQSLVDVDEPEITKSRSFKIKGDFYKGKQLNTLIYEINEKLKTIDSLAANKKLEFLFGGMDDLEVESLADFTAYPVLTPYLLISIDSRYDLIRMFNDLADDEYELSIENDDFSINVLDDVDIDTKEKEAIRNIYYRLVPYIDGITKSFYRFNNFVENEGRTLYYFVLGEAISIFKSGTMEELNKIKSHQPYNLALYREYLKILKVLRDAEEKIGNIKRSARLRENEYDFRAHAEKYENEYEQIFNELNDNIRYLTGSKILLLRQ